MLAAQIPPSALLSLTPPDPAREFVQAVRRPVLGDGSAWAPHRVYVESAAIPLCNRVYSARFLSRRWALRRP